MMTELSRIVDERQLMSISQVEQELACNGSLAIEFEVRPFLEGSGAPSLNLSYAVICALNIGAV